MIDLNIPQFKDWQLALDLIFLGLIIVHVSFRGLWDRKSGSIKYLLIKEHHWLPFSEHMSFTVCFYMYPNNAINNTALYYLADPNPHSISNISGFVISQIKFSTNQTNAIENFWNLEQGPMLTLNNNILSKLKKLNHEYSFPQSYSVFYFIKPYCPGYKKYDILGKFSIT